MLKEQQTPLIDREKLFFVAQIGGLKLTADGKNTIFSYYGFSIEDLEGLKAALEPTGIHAQVLADSEVLMIPGTDHRFIHRTLDSMCMYEESSRSSALSQLDTHSTFATMPGTRTRENLEMLKIKLHEMGIKSEIDKGFKPLSPPESGKIFLAVGCHDIIDLQTLLIENPFSPHELDRMSLQTIEDNRPRSRLSQITTTIPGVYSESELTVMKQNLEAQGTQSFIARLDLYGEITDGTDKTLPPVLCVNPVNAQKLQKQLFVAPVASTAIVSAHAPQQ